MNQGRTPHPWWLYETESIASREQLLEILTKTRKQTTTAILLMGVVGFILGRLL